MKKIILIILAALICVSFCSCGEKSPEQKLAEATKQYEIAKKNADAAQKSYDDLKDAIDRYNYLSEQIENAG